MLKIQTLASGSRGNASVITSDTTRILVDVGLTLPQLLRRLEKANIDPETIDAIIVTHEHGDHVCGLEAFCKRFPATVHLHQDTAHIFPSIPQEKITSFNCDFQIGDITIDFFSVPHDSSFCFGYTFKNGDAKISVATDLGRISTNIIEKMSGSQIVLLECNHCLTKLTHNKKYPPFLKRRITSSTGHLSNAASALAIYELAQSGAQQIILAHLSKENNSPTIAYNSVRDFLLTKGITEGQDISIDIASQDEVSVEFQVD